MTFTLSGENLMIVKLILAVLFGAILGLARKGYPIRMRTLALVCLGSTVFTIISIYPMSTTSDPTRVMAQIVTGIGFLGAGVIWKSQKNLSGLTTAAAIWTVAVLGMLLALELWVTALAGLALSFLILKSKDLEDKIMG